MARIRSIKPEFFKHEELQDLELEHPGQYIMLVYAGLWTQCDKNGVFPCKARAVKNEILPYINFDMQKTLDILEKGGFFTKYTSGGRDYGYIPKFNKYQYPGKAEQKSPAKYPEPPAEIANAEPFQGASGQEPEQPGNGSGTVAQPFCDGCDNHSDPEGIQEYRLIGLQEKGNSCGSSEPPPPPIEPVEKIERLETPPDKKPGKVDKPKKPPLREREPRNGHERVEKAYLENWDDLYSQDRVNTAYPVVNWKQTRKLLSAHFAKGITSDKIIGAVNDGLENDFVMRGGYSLATMLSASVLNGLLNSTGPPPKRRHRIASDEVSGSDWEKRFERDDLDESFREGETA